MITECTVKMIIISEDKIIMLKISLGQFKEGSYSNNSKRIDNNILHSDLIDSSIHLLAEGNKKTIMAN